MSHRNHGRPQHWPLALCCVLLAGCLGPHPAPTGETRLRIPSRSFNTLYQAAVQDGVLWTKRDGDVWKSKGKLPGWFTRPPVHQISMDDQYLVATDATGRLYTRGRDDLLGVSRNAMCPKRRFYLSPKCKGQSFSLFQCARGCDQWSDRWGHPLWSGGPQTLPPHTIAWALSSVSPVQDVYYDDAAGQRQYIGNGNCTTVFALNEPAGATGWKERITILDPWLPADYSYEIDLPEDGRFLAKNLSASGSTVFVINAFGDMFTRRWDFDMSGADHLFFPSDFEAGQPTNFPEPKCGHASKFKVKLPAPGWVEQPKIKAAPGEVIQVSDQISISKNDTPGCLDRTLRVAGTRNGVPGYWEKPLDAAITTWTFQAWPVGPLDFLLQYSESDKSTDPAALGPAEFSSYHMITGALEVHVDRFNPYLSPATITLTSAGTSLATTLHHVDGLRLQPRARGIDGTVREMKGAIRVEAATLSPALAAASGLVEGWNPVEIEVTTSALVLKRKAAGDWTLIP
jgi:hypothetical protein